MSTTFYECGECQTRYLAEQWCVGCVRPRRDQRSRLGTQDGTLPLLMPTVHRGRPRRTRSQFRSAWLGRSRGAPRTRCPGAVGLTGRESGTVGRRSAGRRARKQLTIYVPLRYHHRPRGRDDLHSYAQPSRFLSPSVRRHLDTVYAGHLDEIAPATHCETATASVSADLDAL